MAERYESQDGFAFSCEVDRQIAQFRAWFKAASKNMARYAISDSTALYEDVAFEQYFAEYWRQFEGTVLAEQPNNPLVQRALLVTENRVRIAFGRTQGSLPWELMEE
jgi:hypothetical protein